MLEVIDKGSYSESDSTPLLFVHGAAHAAWCWVGTEPRAGWVPSRRGSAWTS
jgi:hypothetical protein